MKKPTRPKKITGVLEFLIAMDDFGAEEVFLANSGFVETMSESRLPPAPRRLKNAVTRLYPKLKQMLKKQAQLPYEPEEWE